LVLSPYVYFVSFYQRLFHLHISDSTTVRSAHPAFSLAALGPNANYLVADHAMTKDAGNHSPLGKLYELDGHVLLLGVEHWNNTSLIWPNLGLTIPARAI
jgi:aminoglycoside N3'-acetyltransferase